MLAKLPSVQVDGVVIDLEDGVAPGDRATARADLRAAAEARTLDEDLLLAADLRPARVVLPKAEEIDRVVVLGEFVSTWDGRVGLMIETARGLVGAGRGQQGSRGARR